MIDQYLNLMSQMPSFKADVERLSDNAFALLLEPPDHAPGRLLFDMQSKKWIKKVLSRGNGIHEPGLTKSLLVLEKICGNRLQNFFDVGMHQGYYTLFANQFMQSKEIFGFEMNPESFDISRSNIGLLEDSRKINLISAGVSSSSIADVPCSYKGYTLRTDVSQEEQLKLEKQRFVSAKLDLIALDDFCAQKGIVPDLLKIDVEGSQRAILEGMRGILNNTPPVLLIETDGPKSSNGDGTSMRSICDMLIDAYKYTLVAFDHRIWDFHPSVLSSTDRQPETNLEKNQLVVAFPERFAHSSTTTDVS